MLAEYGVVFAWAAVIGVVIFFLAAVIGIGGGILLALVRTSSAPGARWVAIALVEGVRNTPLMVLLLWIHYGLPSIVPLQLSPFQSGVVGLGACSAAYFSEVFRAGIASVDGGQRDAARALGFSRGSAVRRIVLPQAIRHMLPALTNTLIMVWKATSILSLLGIPELTRVASRVTQETARPFQAYAIASAAYISVSLGIIFALRRLERRARGKVRSS
jgi:His/Glu/Gln/Arg/opine family amino acid ABC transporter permease subunit